MKKNSMIADFAWVADDAVYQSQQLTLNNQEVHFLLKEVDSIHVAEKS